MSPLKTNHYCTWIAQNPSTQWEVLVPSPASLATHWMALTKWCAGNMKTGMRRTRTGVKTAYFPTVLVRSCTVPIFIFTNVYFRNNLIIIGHNLGKTLVWRLSNGHWCHLFVALSTKLGLDLVSFLKCSFLWMCGGLWLLSAFLINFYSFLMCHCFRLRIVYQIYGPKIVSK